MNRLLKLMTLSTALCLSVAVTAGAEIKVGGIFPMTRTIAFIGEAMSQGTQLVLDEVNAAGGINGEKVTIQVEDSQSDPKAANNAVAKLIEVDKIHILLGPARSGSVLASTPLVEKAGAVLMAPVSTHPDVPQAKRGVFRTCPSDGAQGAVGAVFAQTLGLKRIAIIYKNDDYGKGLADVFANKARELGMEIPIMVKYAPTDQDFRTQLTKIRAKKADGLYIVANMQTPNIVKQANLLKLRVTMIGAEGTKDPQILKRAGKDMEGMWCTSPPYWPESQDPTTQKFVKRFRAKYPDQEPRMFTAMAYDGMMALVEAMKTKGSSPMQIRDGLLALKEFPGATGEITMLANGDVEKPFAVFKVEDGKYVFKKFIK